ncbi:MAG: hypothetical protein JXR46_16350, partial [Calditrichaceae bacterium]|nr:hypothetical protein [Calditrichaceae bacterium]
MNNKVKKNPIFLIIISIVFIILFNFVIFVLIDLPASYVVSKFSKAFFSLNGYLLYKYIYELLITLLISVYFIKKYNLDISLKFKVILSKKQLILIAIISISLWIISKSLFSVSKLFLPENYPAILFYNKYTLYNSFPYNILFILISSTLDPISEIIYLFGFCYQILRISYNIKISTIIIL